MWSPLCASSLKNLTARAAEGQSCVDDADVVDLVAELRNSIHEVPLSDEIQKWDETPGKVCGEGLVACRGPYERERGNRVPGRTDQRLEECDVAKPVATALNHRSARLRQKPEQRNSALSR
jgi:hypothetical protein